MHPGTDRAPTHNLEYLPGKEQNSYTKRNTTTKQPLYSRFPTREVLLIKITYYARAMHRHARARFTEGYYDSSSSNTIGDDSSSPNTMDMHRHARARLTEVCQNNRR